MCLLHVLEMRVAGPLPHGPPQVLVLP
jgi:hypothetical protein